VSDTSDSTAADAEPAAPELAVRDAVERQRFEGRLGPDGPLAAILTYDLEGDRITLRHTEVLEAYEGRGLGSRLVGEVFADLRARGIGVVARCPFVVAWLERHPGEQDILVEPLRGRDQRGA
jgi:predicted GNAT family acetyltransferase